MNTTTATTVRGETITSMQVGNRLSVITEQGDGTYRVSCFIAYSDGDRNWCDGATYKTAAGAQRKAKAFLK